MPFMLYDVAQQTGYRLYTKVKNIQIAGNRGPLAAFQRKRNGARQVPFKWHATSADIVAEIGGSPTQEIVIDLKPNDLKKVSLYRLLDIWGFSYAKWSSLALLLETIFGDRNEHDVKGFKHRFDDRHADRLLVGEFLYVQGGVTSGTWNWGQVGRVNGALLGKEAFIFLAGELGKKLCC